VAVLAALAVGVVNSASVQTLVGGLPILDRLATNAPTGMERLIEILLTVVVVVGAFLPLYKPQPRRILDMVTLAQKRVFVALFALAAIGYFDYTYRLPRLTLLTLTPVLLVAIPAWFVWIRQRPTSEDDRAVIIGDDPAGIERVVKEYDGSLIGYVAPPTPYRSSDPDAWEPDTVADGGLPTFEQGYVGGLSRFNDIIAQHSIDSAILAFEDTDRAEFFGTLHTCHEHGIDAKTHVDHIDSILINSKKGDEPIVDIDLDPWDAQDRLFKRLFDLTVAATALLILSPVIILITVGIKIEGNGPILFEQERTFRFGNTFSLYKFRTLKPEPEGEVGTTFDDNRRTPLGDFLRTTHLDEIPQLWSILVGDMSVVGPRPAQTDLEDDFENKAATWRRRWFVKPGLTGLAQIHDATSQEPSLKLDYDVEYIRQQSLSFDMKIVLRQLWQVAYDVGSLRENNKKSK